MATTLSLFNFGLAGFPPQIVSTSFFISFISRIGSDESFTAFNKSFRFGFIAIPLSVTITSISSPGPQRVVTSSTITGILSRKDGIASIVHFE